MLGVVLGILTPGVALDGLPNFRIACFVRSATLRVYQVGGVQSLGGLASKPA